MLKFIKYILELLQLIGVNSLRLELGLFDKMLCWTRAYFEARFVIEPNRLDSLILDSDKYIFYMNFLVTSSNLLIVTRARK